MDRRTTEDTHNTIYTQHQTWQWKLNYTKYHVACPIKLVDQIYLEFNQDCAGQLDIRQKHISLYVNSALYEFYNTTEALCLQKK